MSLTFYRADIACCGCNQSPAQRRDQVLECATEYLMLALSHGRHHGAGAPSGRAIRVAAYSYSGEPGSGHLRPYDSGHLQHGFP
jgi:hypothetical protein